MRKARNVEIPTEVADRVCNIRPPPLELLRDSSSLGASHRVLCKTGAQDWPCSLGVNTLVTTPASPVAAPGFESQLYSRVRLPANPGTGKQLTRPPMNVLLLLK